MSAIPSSQLKAWRVALEFLRQRGFLGDSSSAGEGSVGKGGRNCDIDSDRTEEQVAELLRVLMICEANIFGTEEDEEEGEAENPRSLSALIRVRLLLIVFQPFFCI